MSRKFEKNLIVAVPDSLFKEFKKVCEGNYTTMSQEVRNFMLRYTKEHKDAKQKIDDQ